jgi:hypothetical protein
MRALSETAVEKILSGNARRLYKLGGNDGE